MNSLCSNTILIMKSLNNRVVLGAQASGTTPTTKPRHFYSLCREVRSCE